MYKTKSIMLHNSVIEEIESIVEYSNELMLYHSFSAVVRMVIQRGLEGTKEYFNDLGSKRPEVVEVVREKQRLREEKKNGCL